MRKWWIVLLIGFVDVATYSLCLPLFPGVLGVEEREWLWLQGLSNFGAAVAGSLVGWLSDEYGKKMLLVVSQGLSLVCSVLLWLGSLFKSSFLSLPSFAVPSQSFFAVSTVGVWFLSGGFVLRKTNRTFPIACALLSELAENAAERKLWLGRLGGTFGAGFALGPALAGVVSDKVGTNGLFFLGVLFSSLSFLLATQVERPKNNHHVNVEIHHSVNVNVENHTTEENNMKQKKKKKKKKKKEGTTKSDIDNSKLDNARSSKLDHGSEKEKLSDQKSENNREEAGVENENENVDLVRSVSWREVWIKCSDEKVAMVFAVHLFACWAQFLYITSIGIAAQTRFGMDTYMYGVLVSYFGVTYSISMFAVIPALGRVIPNEKTLLELGLFVTGVSRFVAAYVQDVKVLFLVHAFVSIGTAAINLTITNLIAKTGKAVDLTGSMMGVQDSIQRTSGVLAPIMLSAVPQRLVQSMVGYDVYVGAFLSGVFYFVALVVSTGTELHASITENEKKMKKEMPKTD